MPPPLLRTAQRQHDVVRLVQLVEAGVSHKAVAGLVKAGVLHRLHRGIYKVGTPAPSPDGRHLAAVYCAGSGSAISHRDAGELRGLPAKGRRGTIDVTAIDTAMRRANGRDLRAICAAIDAHRPRDRREIEARLAGIASRAGLHGAHRNAIVLVDGEPFELDCYYPGLLLCLEADGYRVHKTPKKFNSDRRRDRILKLRLGITTLRYTWDDVTVRERESETERATYADR